MEDSDEPTALAFTDFTKPSPVLRGKDAELFYKRMLEQEELARNPTPERLAENKRIKDNYLLIMAKAKL